MEAITRENRNLHAFADATVRVVDKLPRSAPVVVLAADMRSEVEARVAQTKEGSTYERVRAVLDNPSLFQHTARHVRVVAQSCLEWDR